MLEAGIELIMVHIPEGELLLENSHKETVGSFFMSKHPITQLQWQAIKSLPKVSRHLERKPSKFQGKDYPVENVSWYDSVEFCNRLTSYSGRNYKLPSEIEWEYACRAGTKTKFHFGDTITSELANFNCDKVSPGRTVYVEDFDFSNQFGLYGMHGNICEWCLNPWKNSLRKLARLNNFQNNSEGAADRSIRGGSWRDLPEGCQSSYRSKAKPDMRADYIGFRVVCKI